MPVQGVLSFTLQVPELGPGLRFYTDAGLIPETNGNVATLRCEGQNRPSVILVAGAPKKRLHHIRLRADGLDAIADAVPAHGGRIISAPDGFASRGLWMLDANGMMLNVVEDPADPELVPGDVPFTINEPGRIIRKGRSAMLPRSAYGEIKPLRLGHVLLFSPDVMKSVDFMTGALGMGLADQAQDVIAFTCARKNSEHHVVAFAKSPGIGFHHASFQVSDPDQVGRAGAALLEKSGRGDWGFGRHTIGSNFFHYIQDPWGSWFEYYADMDFIEDYSLWRPTNYGMEDSLAHWGPSVPVDFVHNYEVAEQPFIAQVAEPA